jgi:hypothetical protein
MPPLHQELDAMLLGRDRVGIVLRHALHHLHLLDIQLIAARARLSARTLPVTMTLDSCVSPSAPRRPRRDAGLVGHALNRPCAVAKDGKEQLAALAQVVEPAAQGDGLAVMLADLGNGGDGRGNTLAPNFQISTMRLDAGVGLITCVYLEVLIFFPAVADA